MKKRYTEQQIAYALKQSETGVAVEEIIRKMRMSEVYNFCLLGAVR